MVAARQLPVVACPAVGGVGGQQRVEAVVAAQDLLARQPAGRRERQVGQALDDVHAGLPRIGVAPVAARARRAEQRVHGGARRDLDEVAVELVAERAGRQRLTSLVR